MLRTEGILFGAFEDFRFVGSYTSSDGAELLHFLWRLGDRAGEGVDMLRFDGDGLIEDYRVIVRPLSAVVALRSLSCPKRPSLHSKTYHPSPPNGRSGSSTIARPSS
jgi:hypothetical protein